MHVDTARYYASLATVIYSCWQYHHHHHRCHMTSRIEHRTGARYTIRNTAEVVSENLMKHKLITILLQCDISQLDLLILFHCKVIMPSITISLHNESYSTYHHMLSIEISTETLSYIFFSSVTGLGSQTVIAHRSVRLHQ